MNKFNEKEFKQIKDMYGKNAWIRDEKIIIEEEHYFNYLKNSIETDRRGEVTFCVKQKNGKFIVVTCNSYPKGIYRIPTGGINYEEDIIEAVYRETFEELGLKTKIDKFLGVVRIHFSYKDKTIMFYSYIFILDEISGYLLEDATDDEVSEVREVGLDGLKEMSKRLKHIDSGRWKDWGIFRYYSTHAIIDYLENEKAGD